MYAPSLFQHTHKHTDACSYWSITEGFARCLLLFLYSNFVLVWKFQCFVGRKDPERPDLMRKWHQERKKKVWLQSHENPAAFLFGWKGELGGLSMSGRPALTSLFLFILIVKSLPSFCRNHSSLTVLLTFSGSNCETVVWSWLMAPEMKLLLALVISSTWSSYLYKANVLCLSMSHRSLTSLLSEWP